MQGVTPCCCLWTITCLDCIHSNKQSMGGKGDSGHCPTLYHSPYCPPPCSPIPSLSSLFPPLSSSSPPPPSAALTAIWDGERCCCGPEGGPLQLLLLLVFLLDSIGIHLGLNDTGLNQGVNACTVVGRRDRTTVRLGRGRGTGSWPQVCGLLSWFTAVRTGCLSAIHSSSWLHERCHYLGRGILWNGMRLVACNMHGCDHTVLCVATGAVNCAACVELPLCVSFIHFSTPLGPHSYCIFNIHSMQAVVLGIHCALTVTVHISSLSCTFPAISYVHVRLMKL